MQALLSFDKAPPFAAPLRFFLTGPLFAAAAGGLLLMDGPELLASRWQPAALAAVHLVTVGFLLQIMLGALIQLLPVVAGANLPRPLLLARWVHGGLIGGGGLLAWGFYTMHPQRLAGATALLVMTGGGFAIAMGRALWHVPSTSPTIRGLKLAVLGLLGVLGLGGFLSLALIFGWPVSLPALVDLHAGWGLGAWAGVLLAAVAYVVVPMFQLTPGYPARAGWCFPVVLLGALLVWSVGVWLGVELMIQSARLAVALVGAGFCALTWRLQSLRRRARPDVTYRYWQIGLLACILAFAMLSTAAIRPQIADHPAWTPAFGILLVVGGLMSFVIGMLYKIVPFLAWLHLQNCGQGKLVAPAMNKLLSESMAFRQMLVHLLSCGLLLGATACPEQLARPAGGALLVANLWLAWNLVRAVGRYRQYRGDMLRKLAL